MLLIITAISVGLSGYLWTGKSRIQANDIKFRAIRQVYPIQANWADNYYAQHPEAMKDKTERLENEPIERSQVNDMLKQEKREVRKSVKQFKTKIRN